MVRSVGVGPKGSGKVPVEGAAGGWRWRVPETEGTSRERGDLPQKRGARRRQCAWRDSCCWKCEVGRKDLLVLGKVGFLEVKKKTRMPPFSHINNEKALTTAMLDGKIQEGQAFGGRGRDLSS